MTAPTGARLLAVFASVLTLLGALVVQQVTVAPMAVAGTDDYPVPWRPPAAQDSMFDSWGEYNRECTSFVAWRLHSRNGFEVPFHDNDSMWGSDALNRGHTVNVTPAVGAVAWWSNNHVAWVERVNSGGTVTVEEYNHGLNGTYSERAIAASSPSGYIHFKDLADPFGAPNYQFFVGDFNGDGMADIGLRDSANGIFYIKHGPVSETR